MFNSMLYQILAEINFMQLIADGKFIFVRLSLVDYWDYYVGIMY